MPMTGPPRLGEILQRGHDRRETRDRAAAQVIAIGETARQHDRAITGQGVFLVPDQLGIHPEHVTHRVKRVGIAVGAGKL